MNQVWTTEDDGNGQNAVRIGEETILMDGEITGEDIKEIASDHGIKKFKVEDSEGSTLENQEFPVEQDVKIVEYNENAR